MRILVETHHPAHIHLFKHAVREWQQLGHRVRVVGRDRDVMLALLRAYDWLDYRVSTRGGRDNRFPAREFALRQASMAKHLALFRPDVVLSAMGSYTQLAGVARRPNLVFTDSEHQAFNHRIAHPFATHIYTPECFHKDLGPKQHRYAGYHELAFLHPRRFTPRPEVLEKLGLEPHSYTILRTSAFNTLHDIGQSGLGPVIDEVVELALAEGPVVVVGEGGKVPAHLEPYRFRLAPDWFHDAIAYARLVISEGASTASEASCLGIPSVYVNTHGLGYLRDQAVRYGLVHDLRPGGPIVEAVKEKAVSSGDRARWEEARQRLVDEHVDVTDVIVNAALDAARSHR
jgi:predicted glycosyltransferase